MNNLEIMSASMTIHFFHKKINLELCDASELFRYRGSDVVEVAFGCCWEVCNLMGDTRFGNGSPMIYYGKYKGTPDQFTGTPNFVMFAQSENPQFAKQLYFAYFGDGIKFAHLQCVGPHILAVGKDIIKPDGNIIRKCPKPLMLKGMPVILPY